MPDREEPIRGLVVGESDFEPDGLSQIAQRILMASFGSSDSRRCNVSRNSQHLAQVVLPRRRVCREFRNQRIQLRQAFPRFRLPVLSRKGDRGCVEITARETRLFISVCFRPNTPKTAR
jgi:hypothetical protein